MNKQSLEFQLQQNTQRDIANLKHDVGELINAYALVDSNMRKAYSMMVTEQNKLTVRVNFLIEEVTKLFGDKEKFETMYKEYEKDQMEKMQTQIVEIIKKQQEETEKKAAGENHGSPIIQR